MRLGSCVPLFACALLISSCNHRPPPVVTVTPTSMDTLAIQSANREFALEDYVSAARDYERYLQLVPSGGDRDQALFHLGIIYTLPEGERQDWPRAVGYLSRLVTEFPQSPLKPPAQVILSSREQATQLSVDVSGLNNEMGQLRNEIAQLRNEASQLRNEGSQLRTNISQVNEELAKVKADAAAQIALEVEKRDQKIKELNTQLERLIRIDADRRRPARP